MRSKVLPVLTNAINPSLSGSESQRNVLNPFIRIIPNALIPAKHLFIHWSMFGRHGIPIMGSPAENSACASVQPGMFHSLAALMRCWTEQMGWATTATAAPQLPRTPLLPASQKRAIVPCSTRAWVAPILVLSSEPEHFYLLNSTTPAVEEGCADTCWTSHPPSSFVSSLLPPKRVTAPCGGLKGMGSAALG